MGIIFLIIALLSWGVGDFLIQKSARKFGDWISLLYITAFGSVILLPFVYKDVIPLLWNAKGFLILICASIILVFTAYFDFEALRVGKISVVEPIHAFEVAIAAILAGLFLKEYLNFSQIILVGITVIGIFLVSSKSLKTFKKLRWEKGVLLAVIGTVGLGTSNFIFGVGARE